MLADANRQPQELREAEARGAKLLEQSRHQATELTNSARAEVEQTLEARAQANAIIVRAQQGAEQLSAAGLGDEAISGVSEAIVRAAQVETETEAPAELPERSGPVAVTPPESETPSEPTREEGDEDSPKPQ